MKFKRALGLCLLGSYSVLFSAQVPEGVKLAPVQVLRIDLGFKPENVHPHYSTNFYENWVVRDLFEGLVALDAKGKHTAGAAVRWEANTDYTTWTFHLRPEARWSNGEAVTAQDFVYGMQTLLMSDSQNATDVDAVWKIKNAEAVKRGVLPVSALGIQAIDAHTLQINLQASDAFFPERCGISIVPLHKHSTPTMSGYFDTCLPIIGVTNGPYCSLSYYTNLKYQAERNPHYWDNARTVIDQVEYYFTEDVAIRHERFSQGKMDLSDLVSNASGLGEQYKAKFGGCFQQFYSTDETSLSLNVDKKPFNNVKVRQALKLNMVIDREAMLRYLKQPQNLPVYSKLHPKAVSAPLLEPEWVSWSYEKRVVEARKQIKGLKFPPITLVCSTIMAKTKLPAYLAETWKTTLGIEVKVFEADFPTLLQKLRNKDFMMLARGCVYDNPSFPWSFLAQFVKPARENRCNYHNPKLVKLLEDALSPKLSTKQREAALLKANYLLANEGPVISLSYDAMDYLVQPYVGGMDPDNLEGAFQAKELYLVDHSSKPNLEGMNAKID